MTPGRRRFSVEEFHPMAQAGRLGEDDRVELLELESQGLGLLAVRRTPCA
ncbi:hypothetical protein RLTM_09493 [Thermus parvatiensis]|uniref:Uncharacterized protein n=1 Tax=Thermus parvatiensis TaxID=456163 RepID=H7GHX4_9DEIN|nr:hypothetical protein RLTM_09493 [Thermus parvatiensis]